MRSQRMSLSTLLAMPGVPTGTSMRNVVQRLGPSFGSPKSKGTGALKAARSPAEVTRLKTAAQAKREQRWARNLANARPEMILRTEGSSR